MGFRLVADKWGKRSEVQYDIQMHWEKGEQASGPSFCTRNSRRVLKTVCWCPSRSVSPEEIKLERFLGEQLSSNNLRKGRNGGKLGGVQEESRGGF